MRIVFALLFFMATFAYADQWSPPTTSSFSSNEDAYVLRIEPGDGKNNALAVVYKYKKTEKNYAVFRRFSLVNTDAPVYAFISDDGIIFTFDDWYHMGHDHALIKYDIDGRRIREWPLTEIFNTEQYEKLLQEHQTKSSIGWRIYIPYFIGTQFIIPHSLNDYVVVSGEKMDFY